jgi:hypothetical protein
MSAGRDITSPAELPARMRAKITEELCPVAGLDGFCWTWTGCVQSKGRTIRNCRTCQRAAQRRAYRRSAARAVSA